MGCDVRRTVRGDAWLKSEPTVARRRGFRVAGMPATGAKQTPVAANEHTRRGRLAGHEHLRIVLVAAAIGIPAAFAAALFLALVHDLEHWLWTDLPDSL